MAQAPPSHGNCRVFSRWLIRQFFSNVLHSIGLLNLTSREGVPEAAEVHTLMYKTYTCIQSHGILSLLAGSGRLNCIRP